MYLYWLRHRVRCLEFEADLAVGPFQTYPKPSTSWARGGKEGHPPPPPKGGPPRPGFLSEDAGHDLVPGGGVSVAGGNQDKTTGQFFAQTCVGHTCDPVGG